MRKDQDSAVEALVEQLIEGGSENMAPVFAGLFNLAMRIERERFLGAGHYERTPECIAPGSLDTSLSHAAGLSDIAVCHA